MEVLNPLPGGDGDCVAGGEERGEVCGGRKATGRSAVEQVAVWAGTLWPCFPRVETARVSN